MPSGSGAVRAGFTPDLAGDYVGPRGHQQQRRVSDPCEVTLESIPSKTLG